MIMDNDSPEGAEYEFVQPIQGCGTLFALFSLYFVQGYSNLIPSGF
jgi:hypothetical protein